MRFKANISVAALCCVFLMSVMLAFAACDKNRKEPEYIPNPVVEISFDRFQGDGVLLSVRSINTDAVYGIARKMSEPAPEAEEIVEEGTSVEDGDLFIGGLEKEVEYTVYAVGVREGRCGKVASVSFKTPSLYSWEIERTEIPFFADLDLLPGGVTKKQPSTWDEQRLLPHVTFTDETGKEQWLHEAFLLIGGEDASSNSVLCIPDGKEKSADQKAWKDFADYWLKAGGVVDVLDKTIANAAARIGSPSFRHSVVITMPDPVMLEYFSDKNSSTSYWGELYGRRLDFRNVSDQILAYTWYIDYVREAWEKASPENLELAGFYILSEILVAKPDGWNYQYKRWDQILPSVSAYLHERRYGLYWIPYYQADGYDMAAELGIDYTWLQPNKYWDYPEKKQKKEWSWVFNTMNMYGHGMEIEFEGSHGEPGWSQYESGVPRTSSSILETVRTSNDAEGTPKGQPNPQAARNKQLLRDYMQEFKRAGCYGKARIATYSGTNAMYELATSPDQKDREMYLEYCRFIVENPLRK